MYKPIKMTNRHKSITIISFLHYTSLFCTMTLTSENHCFGLHAITSISALCLAALLLATLLLIPLITVWHRQAAERDSFFCYCRFSLHFTFSSPMPSTFYSLLFRCWFYHAARFCLSPRGMMNHMALVGGALSPLGCPRSHVRLMYQSPRDSFAL